jgi:hypothetical protein
MLRHALKEWAVICRALADGRQSLLLRKGGIAEESETFAPEQKLFWLFPTYTHHKAQAIKPDAKPLFDEVHASQPPAGQLRLDCYAELVAAYEAHDLAPVLLLDHLHIWSEEVIRLRFAYERSPRPRREEPGVSAPATSPRPLGEGPGVRGSIYVLLLRTYKMPRTVEVLDRPEYAGCKSWVTLREPLSTEGGLPVMNDDDFRNLQLTVERILKPIALA